MKDISLPQHIFFESPDATPTAVERAAKLTAEVRRNGTKVILAGLYIERELEQIIGYYLYPATPVTDQQRFVAGHILGSDTMTFAAKRRLIRALVNERDLLKGSDKNDLDVELGKVMKYRNAFTHGDVIEKQGRAYLKYFDNGPLEKELTDAFWDDVVQAIRSAEKRLQEVKKSLGMPLGSSPNGGL